jgi:hypothetical protein
LKVKNYSKGVIDFGVKIPPQCRVVSSRIVEYGGVIERGVKITPVLRVMLRGVYSGVNFYGVKFTP